MFVNHIKKALKGYLKSQISLLCINTFIYWMVFLILNIGFAFPLAVLTGIFTLMPLYGIFVSLFLISLVSLFDGKSFTSLNPLLETILIILILIVINQLIDWLISPYIIASSLKINALVLILTVILATSLFGFLGAILAVPVLIIIKAVLSGNNSGKPLS